MIDEEAMDDSSSSEIQKQMAKLHIEEIRTQKFSIGSDQASPLRNDLLEALTNLPKDANFLRELILVFSPLLFNVVICLTKIAVFYLGLLNLLSGLASYILEM